MIIENREDFERVYKGFDGIPVMGCEDFEFLKMKEAGEKHRSSREAEGAKPNA